MDLTESGYCRLCAELKPSSKLLNLQYDVCKLQEVTEKLQRLNATADFSKDSLPKSICFICISKLNQAFDFVNIIEQAQRVLSSLFTSQIKVEIPGGNDIDDDHSFHDDSFLEQPDLKDEYIPVKEESDDLTSEIKNFWNIQDEQNAKIFKRKKIKYKETENITLDAIPLSQLKLTWKDYNWTCTVCETQFPTVDDLTKHSVQFHECCNTFRCTDCNIRKLRLNKFISHIKSHRKYLKLSCYKCFKKFGSSREVIKHQQEHVDSEHKCHGCNTIFPTAEECSSHVNSFYKLKKKKSIELPELPRSVENLTCLLCKKTFKQKSSLHTHLLIHTERKRDHTCEKCGKCFLNKQNLAGHMILHDNARPFQCEICKACFKTNSQLRSHVGVHDSKKPFSCEQCGRCFRLQKQLASHKIIHTDTLPHICSFCNKGFRFKTILNQHIRQHTGFKPYSCKMCQRDFTNWPNYNKHMKRRHGTDMAKKKHTPDGVYPIDPVTGEIIIPEETSKIIEWKKQIMELKRPGRPKVKVDTVNDSEKVDDINIVTKNEVQTI